MQSVVLWSALLGSIFAGLSVGCFVLGFVRPTQPSSSWSLSLYQHQRRQRMRSQNWVYRTFEPHIAKLSTMLQPRIDDSDSRVQLALRSSQEWKVWTGREFMATKIIEGLFVAATVFVLVSVSGFTAFALLLAIALAASYPLLCRQSILSQAEQRLKRQRIRLPFVIDQIALMMQAGGSFEDSLRSVAEEDPEHPLTEELRIVLSDISAGRTRRDALKDLRNRIPDPEVGELLFSIIKGEELGTPLSAILSEQAEQMRIKRSQWGEKAAAEAEVQIVFPGMLVMIACLIVVLGPILLPAVMNMSGTGDR